MNICSLNLRIICGLHPHVAWHDCTFEVTDLATLAHLVVRMRLSFRLQLTALDDRDSSSSHKAWCFAGAHKLPPYAAQIGEKRVYK